MAELKAGYKKTDIGVIPEDWGVMPISSLCEIVSGGTPSTANPAFWFKGDKPWCTPSDITGTSGKYLYKTDRNITSLGLSKSSANLLPEGTLLLCSRATIGEVKIAKTKIATNQGFKSLVCNSIDNEFMYYKVLTLKDKLLQFSIGSTFLEFSKKDIARLHIDVPKPEEQKAIAAALSDVDGLIESLEQLIAKKRDMKTAVMQQLLTGKKRLPGFDGGWEELTLEDVCSEIGDGTHYTPKYVSEGIPFYSVENVTANDFDNVKYITHEEHNLLVKRCRPEKGDVLLTRIGSIGDTRLIDWEIDASIYVSLALLKTNQKAEAAYVYEYTKSSFFIKDIESRSLLNATPKKINMGDIKGVPINCPKSREEQLAIATILSDMDSEIDALEQRLEKNRCLKTGMMQELLTGKTRLIKMDKLQEAVA